MKLHLASTAELYAEHRRTGSTRKRERIAAELQRRHDELNTRPGYGLTWWAFGDLKIVKGFFPGVMHFEPCEYQIQRFNFALQLPVPQSAIRNPQSEIA